MKHRLAVIACVIACSGKPDPIATVPAPTGTPTTTTDPKPPTPPTSAAPVACAPGLPAAACTSPGIRWCTAGDKDRVGEWRFALVAPLYEPTADVSADELAAAWRDGTGFSIAATAETRGALAGALGQGKPVELGAGARPEVAPKRWAILPAHELTPHWKVVTVAGQHPLSPAPTQLVAALCGPAAAKHVRNIDPARITRVVMSGTTAMTRNMARVMDDKGPRYPARDVKAWFGDSDFVHISNEVSFKPNCDAGKDPYTLSFCSRESYIELLEEVKTNIIELTGSHLRDQGREWINHSIEMYEKRGWIWFGGGRNQVEATAPRLVEHHGNKLAFVGCNLPWTELKVIRDDGPGVAACDWPRVIWQIQDLRRRGYVPIVSIQHDENYVHDPPDSVVRDLRRVAEAGPAFVQGSQAHCAHPWETHYRAFVHYGNGNIFFDLGYAPLRDATTDKLYIHDNKLLTVELLYTRLEESSRPRPLSAKERVGYLKELERALAKLRPAKPWAEPELPEATRTRPDSFMQGGVNQTLAITVPAAFDDKRRYPLIIDLDNTAGVRKDAFVVTRTGTKASAAAITKFMVSKYPIDADHITVTGAKK